jgi:acyl carrier protein
VATHRDEVLAQVSEALENELGVEPERITGPADLRADLELDSLDLVELVAVLEDRIGGKLDGPAVDGIRTVDDVIDLIIRQPS